MENQAADALMGIFGMKRVDDEKRKEMMIEAMRQASEDQRKVLDKWTANAQDSNKIYWKG